MIRFIFKTSLFLVAVLVVISFFAGPSSKGQNQPGNLNTLDTLSAIRDTVSDLGNFCDRNAETCKTGKVVLNSIGERVRNGAKVTYDYLDTKFKDDPQAVKEENRPLTTGSIPAKNQTLPAPTAKPH